MTNDPPAGREPVTVTGLRDWQDLVRERFVALDIDARADSPFAGTVGRSHTVGALDVTRVRSGTQTFRRTAGLITTYGEDVLQVGYVRSGVVHLEQDGRACDLAAGDCAIYDATRPFTWTMSSPWTMDVFTWPRGAVGAADDHARTLTARTLDVGPVAQVARAALAELGRVPGDVGGAGGVLLASRVADLVLGAAEWCGAPTAPADDLRVDTILEFIELNLRDPRLSPDHVAQRFHLSRRSLQRLFATQPRGVSDWIRYRRLDHARADLAREPRRTVASVAAQYCFSTPTIFARAFRNEFGYRPRQARSGPPTHL